MEKLVASPSANKTGPHLDFCNEERTTNGTIGRTQGEKMVRTPAKKELKTKLLVISFSLFD
tara:strand:- start:690 stop:872 length:183 start_codon:yes stop_codon:yes gene_type:complete